MTTAVPTEPAAARSRQEQRRRALATLARFGQTHVPAAWDRLTLEQQDQLLAQIDRIDWELVDRLFRELVRERRAPVTLPSTPWQPAEPSAPDEETRSEGLHVLRDTTRSPFAILVLAGGTGSRLRFPHAKGLFPATPLSGMPLYEVMVEKSKAAARAFGHDRMFPMIVMVSDDTVEETRAYFEAKEYFGEAERILIVQQEVLPLLDRRPGREGLVVMVSGHELAMGGAGHGDALDVVLTRDAVARQWMESLGVRYVQLVNVDNPLAPLADPMLLGAHIRSEAEPVPGHAHISMILIPKSATPRLGSVIEYRENGERRQRSYDYGLLPEVDGCCQFGDASLKIVTVESLRGSAPIPFTVVAKSVTVGGERIPVWKFERSSVHKERYGALVRRESDDVFAPIKERNEDASIETPAASALLQSDHWKKLLSEAAAFGGASADIAASSVVELPWDADYVEPRSVAAALSSIDFPAALLPDSGYLVARRFANYRDLPLRPTPRAVTSSADGHSRDPDMDRRRAIVAAYNNVFEHDPDIVVRAPGRNTAIGDHLDYPPLPQDGSATSRTVAWATQQNILVAAGRRLDHGIKLYAVNEHQTFTLSLDDLEGLASEAAHSNLPDVYGQPLFPWAMSTLALLYSAARGVPGVRSPLPLHGAAFAFEGNVPQGAGQSSSAALLVGIALACNELFGWEIPLDDAFTLADIARSGEHEDYSPFIKKGRAGYLDQMVSLTAREDRAVVIDHGDYSKVELVDLSAVESHGYRNVVVLSGLSRSLGETEYATRVDELRRIPDALNAILSRRREAWIPKSHVYQFSTADWAEARDDLELEHPVLAQRARYVFEERDRTTRFLAALAQGRVDELVECVNASGAAMAMTGPYEISGFNYVPPDNQRIPALDTLREIVLRRAGSGAAARLIGGGGAGPLYVLVPTVVCDRPGFAEGIIDEWREVTGLTARIVADPPARGAGVAWRRGPMTVVRQSGPHRIETYTDVRGDAVYRLVDGTTGTSVEVVPCRGTIRAITAVIDGLEKAILYNPERNAAENGAAPYLGPWANRIRDGRGVFEGRAVDLMNDPGVRDDGDGHALHGLMTYGWRVDEERTRIDGDGIKLVSRIETTDYTTDPAVRSFFGPARTVLMHRLQNGQLQVQSTTTHMGARDSHRVPVLAAVHPWFLLHRQKHGFAELVLPADRHRITAEGANRRLRMIPVAGLPALPIPRRSRNDFRRRRRLGSDAYDVNLAGLHNAPGWDHPVIELRDWFRDILVRVGVFEGFDEFVLYRPGDGTNTVCLEPQVGSINALGEDGPPDVRVPSIAPGESFTTRMYFSVSTLSTSGVRSDFAAADAAAWSAPDARRFPVLITSGLDRGPLAQPEKTATQKDPVRVFFGGRWHIYGTGHEMKDIDNPPPGHRPHRGSILFHLVSPNETGPYAEEDPPLLLGRFPPGIYEAPAVIAQDDVLHLYAQTTYYRLGGSIEHFVSRDGHHFTWTGTALHSIRGGPQAGVYDADVTSLPDEHGRYRQVMVYSAFAREGSRDDRPDPQLFVALSEHGWDGPFVNGERPILRDTDVPWHNSHDPGNPYYEWGLEGAQLLALPNGQLLLLSVGFEKRPGRDYMAAQRLFFALFDRQLRLIEVSNPLLPLHPGWDEYGHGSMMIDANDARLLRMLFQARPANEDKTFRDSNSWRLFEAVFDISHLR